MYGISREEFKLEVEVEGSERAVYERGGARKEEKVGAGTK